MHETIVELRGVTKHFDGNERAALSEVDLGIRSGEIFGVIGESGAGKTTLFELVNGLQRPDAGDLRVAGRDVPRSAVGGCARFAVTSACSSRACTCSATAPSARTSPCPRAGAPHRPSHACPGARSGRRDARLRRSRPSRRSLPGAALRRGAPARRSRPRARGPPSLLLCDEPTSSLDAKTTADVLGVLLRAQRELGTTILVITHDLDVVKAICDRAALLEEGRLVELFDVARTDYRSLPSYREQVRRELKG
ncbi:ATP-binding cassette domain-containing protein [Microbacterium sp. NIBRBAC000506063]|nr:ATP-binding cassette domain-containing protein [Microbacterium sp. NIBRBAC000506063]QTV80234.1 ATP-binding cassette domain-containing protein [Microbacterium sp. NIBRBAC000506063]